MQGSLTSSLDNVDFLNIVESSQKIQSNLKWNGNTEYICTKAYARLCMIWRLQSLGATANELVDVFEKQVRCILELAVAVWAGNLTQLQVAQIECVQRTCCHIILGDNFEGYEDALAELNLQRLSDRRNMLCLNFARKAIKSKKYKNWFEVQTQIGIETRSEKNILKPVTARTRNFKKSPIPHLTALLNENPKYVKL